MGEYHGYKRFYYRVGLHLQITEQGWFDKVSLIVKVKKNLRSVDAAQDYQGMKLGLWGAYKYQDLVEEVVEDVEIPADKSHYAFIKQDEKTKGMVFIARKEKYIYLFNSGACIRLTIVC